MATWSDFEAQAPDLAQAGHRLMWRAAAGEALLATVRGDDVPRVHPINVEVVEGRLYAFLLPSAKRTDLERDGRYALHAHIDPASPSEFVVRGRAHAVAEAGVRARVAAAWSFEPDDTYRLFEFEIGWALLGERPDPDDWPPRYRRWTPA